LKPFSPQDFAAVQRATLALYAHRDLESFRKAVPGIFLALIPGYYFGLLDSRLNPAGESARILDVWESRPLCVGKNREALERNLPDHPFTRHSRAHGPTGALILSDFLTLAQLRRTRLYREALKPVKIGHLISVGSMGGPGVASLSIARTERGPCFTERDRGVMETLQPHFDQARANLERETHLRATRSASLKAHGLTPRETEVALWLAQGKANHEIAAILETPVRTLEKHIERILAKLGVENRSAAAVTVAEIIRA
jgi:DNA-binding CsgD family transcriptional regulator